MWKFSSKESNTKIEKVRKRAIQIIDDDFSSPYETLLQKDNSTIQFLMTKIFKTIKKRIHPS